MSRFVVLAVGLDYADVCTDLETPEASARLNREWPAGMGLRWEAATSAACTGRDHIQQAGMQHLHFTLNKRS
jgi:hypothetical protein